MAHILDNLLENAIRYSPRGSRIAVELETNGGRPGSWSRTPARASPRPSARSVFERFYRGAEGKSAGPGTGLGLAIVAELAERWNGRVELLRRPGDARARQLPGARLPTPHPRLTIPEGASC